MSQKVPNPCYKLKYQKGYCTRAYQEELDQQEFNLRAYDEEQAKIKKDAEEKIAKELEEKMAKELAEKNNIWKAVPDNTENIVAKTNIAINSAPEVQQPPKLAIFPAIIMQTSKVITLDCFTLFLHKKLLGFGFPTSNKHFNKPI